MDAMRGTILGQAAELMFVEVADELLHGRHFLGRRSSDRSLMGFCDGNGNVLGSAGEIIAHAKNECESVLPGDETAEEFMEVLSKRLVSHYYITIVHLADALMKQPVVTDQQACRRLIDACISRNPVNSLTVYCPCHTDPMKSEFENAIHAIGKSGAVPHGRRTAEPYKDAAAFIVLTAPKTVEVKARITQHSRWRAASADPVSHLAGGPRGIQRKH